MTRTSTSITVTRQGQRHTSNWNVINLRWDVSCASTVSPRFFPPDCGSASCLARTPLCKPLTCMYAPPTRLHSHSNLDFTCVISRQRSQACRPLLSRKRLLSHCSNNGVMTTFLPTPKTCPRSIARRGTSSKPPCRST